jgi:hypothetical protein
MMASCSDDSIFLGALLLLLAACVIEGLLHLLLHIPNLLFVKPLVGRCLNVLLGITHLLE